MCSKNYCDEVIKLRPHHLLCIQHFEGRGYSRDFTDNMEKLIGALEGINPKITLTCAVDSICSCCPNNDGGSCKDKDKVYNMDRNALELMDLNENETKRYSEYTAVARRIGEDEAQRVCKKCQWQGICYPNK